MTSVNEELLSEIMSHTEEEDVEVWSFVAFVKKWVRRIVIACTVVVCAVAAGAVAYVGAELYRWRAVRKREKEADAFLQKCRDDITKQQHEMEEAREKLVRLEEEDEEDGEEYEYADRG